MTFALPRGADGKLQVLLVRGKEPMEKYGRNASGPVREEVKAAFAKHGINLDRETAVIFQLLLKWDGDRATEIGPYCGGGGHRSGTAWVYDDKLLDPRELGSKKPGGYYHRPTSIGDFNSRYIGGVAHELGHGMGLPHDRQTAADRSKGTSLMGSGNHTYGNNVRGEGTGTFLSPASAMPLATVRIFAGDLPDADRHAPAKLENLETRLDGDRLTISGKVVGAPAYGLIAYNDPKKPEGDYDAVGWTCKVEPDGRFQVAVGEVSPNEYQIRLRVCHPNGTSTRFAANYRFEPGQKELGKLDFK
jgi:hypothetical protein